MSASHILSPQGDPGLVSCICSYVCLNPGAALWGMLRMGNTGILGTSSGTQGVKGLGTALSRVFEVGRGREGLE